MSHSSGSRIAKTDQLQELAMIRAVGQKPVAGGGRSGPRRRRNLPRQSRMVSPSTVSIPKGEIGAPRRHCASSGIRTPAGRTPRYGRDSRKRD